VVTKPVNAAAVKKAVTMGKEMRKVPDTSKADLARKMFETIADEPREVIVQAFVDGAGLTPKGATRQGPICGSVR
jgi:adenylate kinase